MVVDTLFDFSCKLKIKVDIVYNQIVKRTIMKIGCISLKHIVMYVCVK